MVALQQSSKSCGHEAKQDAANLQNFNAEEKESNLSCDGSAPNHLWEPYRNLDSKTSGERNLLECCGDIGSKMDLDIG